MDDIPNSLVKLNQKIRKEECEFTALQRICRSCTGHDTSFDTDILCSSLDCDIYYKRMKSNEKVQLLNRSEQVAQELERVLQTERMQMFLEF